LVPLTPRPSGDPRNRLPLLSSDQTVCHGSDRSRCSTLKLTRRHPRRPFHRVSAAVGQIRCPPLLLKGRQHLMRPRPCALARRIVRNRTFGVTSKTSVYSLSLCAAPTFDNLQAPISIAGACDGSAVDERAVRGAGRGSADAAGWSRARRGRCAPPSTCSIPSLRPLWTPTRRGQRLFRRPPHRNLVATSRPEAPRRHRGCIHEGKLLERPVDFTPAEPGESPETEVAYSNLIHRS
jgi:hypothetical protein